jgi:hypothetical protein
VTILATFEKPKATLALEEKLEAKPRPPLSRNVEVRRLGKPNWLARENPDRNKENSVFLMSRLCLQQPVRN